MDTIYESKYLRVSHNQPNQLFYYVFDKKTEEMTNDEYILLLKDFIKLTRQYRPKRILGDMLQFNFVISPETQEWIDENLFSV